MWRQIIVVTLVPILLAECIQYTDEDALREIFTIINDKFGSRTGNLPRPRTAPAILHQSEKHIERRVEPNESINNEFKMGPSNTHKHNERHDERNVNRRLDKPVPTPVRSNKHSGRETSLEVNHGRKVNGIHQRVNEGHVARSMSQGPSEALDFRQINNNQTQQSHNKHRPAHTTEGQHVASHRASTTPAVRTSDYTIINELTARNVDIKIIQINSSMSQSRDLAQSAKTNSQSARDSGRTVIALQSVASRKKMEDVTARPKVKKASTRRVDEDRWIWDDGASATSTTASSTTPTTTTDSAASGMPTTPDVGDRAAFIGDKCPENKVKFGNECIDED